MKCLFEVYGESAVVTPDGNGGRRRGTTNQQSVSCRNQGLIQEARQKRIPIIA